jgi:hypothetical protein
MADRVTIGMLLLHGGTPKDRESLERLKAALPDGSTASDPDDLGVFEVSVDAASLEDGLHIVWNAVAASGTDDHIVFMEHPEIPEHWRHRTGRPAAQA